MTMSTSSVAFYLHDIPQDLLVRDIEPEHDWHYFGTGISCWIIQTYLRLRQAGWSIELVSTPPRTGIVIVHADHMHTLLASMQGLSKNLTIVCVRADRSKNLYADVEIVQNPTTANNKRTFFIHHWPQPGLIKRDRNRDQIIENIAYKGEHSQLNNAFQDQEWVSHLGLRGIAWITDTVSWQGQRIMYENTMWNDYSKIDLVIAVRNDTNNLYNNKPASKLINSWLAGVPALLGPESAYKQLRRSPLDFIEVSSAAEALAAIDKLRNTPNLYEDMVENGIERSKEFSSDRICNTWAEFLFNTVHKHRTTIKGRIESHLPIGIRYHLRKIMGK